MTRLLSILLLGCVACVVPRTPTLTLVESYPVGTTLDNPDLPETADVWRAMLAGARESVDLSHFYAIDRAPSLLTPVLDELENAAHRGVQVRVLLASTFVETYPGLIESFEGNADIALRILDLDEVSGGVQHAKYMVVDGEDCYLGSANFDWRAMEHIQELGVRVRSADIAGPLLDVFRHDWALAGSEPIPPPRHLDPNPIALELTAMQSAPGRDRRVLATPAFSPRDLLPIPATWDLPQITRLIEEARSEIEIQVLTFDLIDREGRPFRELEQALLAAAARNVQVRILVADWCKRPGIVEGLKDLQRVDGVRVRFVVVPDHPDGFIPFARVVHSKLCVVDRRKAWIGTSNWERGYFFGSRNVGLVLEGEALGERLHGYFQKTWKSPYAQPVDPRVDYEPRRRE